MLGWLRSIFRFFYFAFVTMSALTLYGIFVLVGKDKINTALRLRSRWLKLVPARLGLDITMAGKPVTGTCLFVGNHVSYIDPIAFLSYADAFIVAKAEIRKWPLVGPGASIIGTIFVNREEKTSRLEASLAIRQGLEEGKSILVFPEGTTTDGTSTLPFRPRSFEAAFAARVPVQPFVLRYESPEVAYIGDHTFIPHFFSLFRQKRIRGQILFGPRLEGKNTCEEARNWIEAELSKHDITQVKNEVAQKT